MCVCVRRCSRVRLRVFVCVCLHVSLTVIRGLPVVSIAAILGGLPYSGLNINLVRPTNRQ